MSKKIFIVYGHHNTQKSFNASIRDTFIDEAKKLNHKIDLINLHDEKPLPFFDGTGPNDQILNYRKRLEESDVLFMISPCYFLIVSEQCPPQKINYCLRTFNTEDTSKVRSAKSVSFSSFVSNVTSIKVSFH